MGADAEALIKRLDEEPDITIRRALLLSLGEFDEKELPPASRTSLLPKLQTIYRTDADPGLHAAAEWLLRTWKQEAWLNQVNEEWAKDKEQRAKRLEGIQQQLKASRAASAPGVQPQWYVNGQGQTMVVIPGPVEFVMGSPTTEAGREPNENQHQRRIGRTFALAAKSVTLAEYQRFDPGYGAETQAMVPDRRLPGAGHQLVSGSGILQLVEQTGGVAGERMVLCSRCETPRPCRRRTRNTKWGWSWRRTI